jgi:hypothetical protein
MKEKRNIHEIIVREEPYLHNILDPAQVKKFKKMTSELRDTWTKKQLFRTKTEMEFSVLNDGSFPTKASKYWQCVREQNSHMESLVHLSFSYRKNEIEIKKLKNKLKKESDALEKELIKVEIDEKTYAKANTQLHASHRMREILEWSNFKKIYNDGTFDDKDVNTHQMVSYKKIMENKKNALTPASPQPEIFNILSQAHTLSRVAQERKTLKATKRKVIKRK